MSLVRQQNIFLLQVAELIRKAAELGFVVSGGELYRTAEQQVIHLKAGRSKTLNSQHLKRLAIDLNFFLPAPDGALTLTYDVEALRPLGEYWESLDSANRWVASGTSRIRRILNARKPQNNQRHRKRLCPQRPPRRLHCQSRQLRA